MSSFYWSSTCKTNLTCGKQTASDSITIRFRTLMLIIYRGSGNTLTSNISCPGGENGEWKASKWIVTPTHCGWKWGAHQTGPYFNPWGYLHHHTIYCPTSVQQRKTRIEDFSPKAACYIISSVFVLFFFVFLSFFFPTRYYSTVKPSSQSLTNQTDQGPAVWNVSAILALSEPVARRATAH